MGLHVDDKHSATERQQKELLLSVCFKFVVSMEDEKRMLHAKTGVGKRKAWMSEMSHQAFVSLTQKQKNVFLST